MDDIRKEINEAIAKNMSSMVGQELKKLLEQGEKDAALVLTQKAALENLVQEQQKIKNELQDIKKKLYDAEKREADIDKRETTVKARPPPRREAGDESVRDVLKMALRASLAQGPIRMHNYDMCQL